MKVERFRISCFALLAGFSLVAREVAALPLVSVIATDDYASESSPAGITNTGIFTFTRAGDMSDTLTVQCNFAGTATPVSDYLSLPSAVIFPAGAATVSLTVQAVYSRATEPVESVIVTLATNVAYVVDVPDQATVNIWKNDFSDPALPTVVIYSDGSGAEQIYPGGFVNTVAFTVYRGGPTNLPLTVAYALGGTAFPGVDYTGPLSGLVTIPAGAVQTSFEMSPVDDDAAEGYESITAALVAVPQYMIGSHPQALGEIIDNDSGPIPTINPLWLAMKNGLFTFKVNGTLGQNFLIYNSTNLLDWSVVTTNLVPAGAEFTELANAADAATRFFRAVPQ